MKIFISWSGRESRAIAEFLRAWMVEVIQSLDPFCSHGDVPSGMRWQDVIGKKLAETSFGILIITPQNKQSMWINFEAGALSKHIEETRVIPVTFGMSLSDLELPLSQFQAKEFSRENMQTIMKEINDLLDKPLDAALLDKLFSRSWPELERHIESILPKLDTRTDSGASSQQKRSVEDLLEEILSLTRDLARRVEPRVLPGNFGSGTISGLLGLGAASVLQTRQLNTVTGIIKAVIGGSEKTAHKEAVDRVKVVLNALAIDVKDVAVYGKTFTLTIAATDLYSSEDRQQEIIEQIQDILPRGSVVTGRFTSL